MTMKSPASSSGNARALAVVNKDRRPVANSKIVTSVTRRRANDVLGAVVNCFALVDRSIQSAQQIRIWSGADRFVIGAAVWRSNAERSPAIAIVVGVTVDGVGAHGR